MKEEVLVPEPSPTQEHRGIAQPLTPAFQPEQFICPVHGRVGEDEVSWDHHVDCGRPVERAYPESEPDFCLGCGGAKVITTEEVRDCPVCIEPNQGEAMSWYLEFHAADSTDAKNRLTREETNNPHFRGGAAAVAAIDLLPDMKNSIVYVKTTGHIDATGGNSETVARLIPLEPGL